MLLACLKDREFIRQCSRKDCQYWIPLVKYHNCELVAMGNAPLPLREIAEIMDVSPEGKTDRK